MFPGGQQSPKVRAFVDFLVERLNFDADYMFELCDGVGSRCPDAVAALAMAEAMREKHAGLQLVGGSESVDSSEDEAVAA